MEAEFLTSNLVELIVTGMPNFVGFLVLAYLMWRIITRQLDILERLVDDCLADDGYIDNHPSD